MLTGPVHCACMTVRKTRSLPYELYGAIARFEFHETVWGRFKFTRQRALDSWRLLSGLGNWEHVYQEDPAHTESHMSGSDSSFKVKIYSLFGDLLVPSNREWLGCES